MYRLALRSLVLAATALLLTTSACDSGDTKADGGKKAEPAKADGGAKADAGKADGEAVAADAGAPAEGDDDDDGDDEAEEAEGGAGAAEAGADTAGDTAAGETGEAAPAADDGGDKADDGGGDKPPAEKAEKKPATEKAPAVAKIDGKPLFETKCKSCHGIDGKGDTTIGKKVEIPSLAKTKLAKGKIVSTITNGVPDTKMKGYKGKLSDDEIDAIATYVKKL